jgi:hypothetical protein
VFAPRGEPGILREPPASQPGEHVDLEVHQVHDPPQRRDPGRIRSRQVQTCSASLSVPISASLRMPMIEAFSSAW